ncbi:MAG: cell division protein FtsZ [Candidatus Heimdallarchaeota archaeon]|nr:cell division protein FtsZ [Candidatus Heimdallarchaeota archaeon]
MERSRFNDDYEDDRSGLKKFVDNIDRRNLPSISKKPLGKTNCYIIGVGGGGNNTINRLMSTGIKDALCICINTDLQHLESVKCDSTLLIGRQTTRGLGSGGKPEKGKAAAEESYKEIQRLVSDSDIIFLTCGLGGGTGTGAMPIIAEVAKASGAIVISVVTLPFTHEGSRKETAQKGLEDLQKHSDTVVIIENDLLLKIVPDLPIEEAFSVADEVLANYIHSIINTVTQPGIISVDYADFKSIIAKGGVTVCGVGEAKGEDRAVKAVAKALSNPLISVNYKTGTAALINVTGGAKMSLKEASSVVEIIRRQIQPNAEIIWGTKVDHELGDLLRITVVISGVESEQLIGLRKKPTNIAIPPYDIVGDVSTISSPLEIPQEQDSWMREEDKHITIRDLRDRIKDKQSLEREKRLKLKDNNEDEPNEFWDELGISKGLD